MMRQHLPQHKNESAKSGFTLLELLVVIIIIAVLIALLLPAINGARRNARVAQVKTEIIQLETALAAFKAKFGQYPPSYIKLRVGYDPVGNPGVGWDDTADLDTVKSKAVIQSFWPEYDFDTALADLPWADGEELFGSECLVFFLGGVNSTTTDLNLIGFSKNPTNPFSRSGTNRDRPLLEFNADRLFFARADPITKIVPPDTEFILAYLDPLSGQTTPYIYMSSYDGRGYNAGDFNGAMASVYTQSSGSDWNQESFQIISPGVDATFGGGGLFSPDTAESDLIGTRLTERDNITNFHSGVLAP